MLFTTIDFLVFLFIVFIFYWLVISKFLKLQNIFVLTASYLFYGWWDWKFLFLLLSISLVNYFIALFIQKNNNNKKRKFYFLIGLIINIGTLILFKYFNFFIDGFARIISVLSLNLNLRSINLILPLGISFYIFLSISYIADVYKQKFVATKNIIHVLLSLSFFPIILAGPIQRPSSLLPQIQANRTFKYHIAIDGLKMILWGVFMKVVIADNCSVLVDPIFKNYSSYSGSTLFLGMFLYTIQIYADFAGYSNIAIGIGKLLGFDIMQNFAYPYFSRNIKEFWKRWNISLTLWFRDYVFLPTAFAVSRKIKSNRFLFIKTDFVIYTIGIVITWILTGLWHGANYTFIIWGLLHGVFLIVNHAINKPRKKLLKKLKLNKANILLVIVDISSTFLIIMISWVFFRADSINIAFDYLVKMFSSSLISVPDISFKPMTHLTFLSIVFFIIIEWKGKGYNYPIKRIGTYWPKYLRWLFYYIIIFSILFFNGNSQQFIYFQF